jgi:hypothetical protein
VRGLRAFSRAQLAQALMSSRFRVPVTAFRVELLRFVCGTKAKCAS